MYTPDIELLLDALQEPLNVVHTVDPREAERNYEKWMPAIRKEVGVIEKAVQRLAPEKVKEGGWLKRKEVKVVPSKLVFTVKPPDPPSEGVTPHAAQQGQASNRPVPHAAREGQATRKRKARLVACGNHAPSTGSEVYASGAAAETLRCFVVLCSKRCWWLGSLALMPPRLLVRLGLAREGELWIPTHAVCGPRESPKLWSDFRDYSKDVITALAKAIQEIWKTTPLTMATPDASLRFLGVEILVQGSGFVLSQQAYAEELLRLNNVKPTALGKIPCPRDLACFDTLLADESPTEETVRVAQRQTGEILWLSQRTRPDLAYTACLLASLSTKASERAIRVAERALAYIQRTKAFVLTAGADDAGLIAYSDASYAPEGNRSHTGWVVFLRGSPVCWRSARQAFVTLSTAESELVAGLDAVVALQSAEAMLSDFGVTGLDKTLRVDSQSALAIAVGQGSWRTRHLRVRANYLREQYESGEIIPVYCPGAEQAADLLTKALAAARITELAAIWGLLDHSLVVRHAGAVADAQPHSAGAGALVQQDLQLSTLAVLLACMQVVGAASQGDEELEDISVSIVCIGICFIGSSSGVLRLLALVGFQGGACHQYPAEEPVSYSACGIKLLKLLKPNFLHVRKRQAHQRVVPHNLPVASRHVEHQLAFMLPLRGRSSTEPRPALLSAIRPSLLSTRFASSATVARRTVLSIAQGRNHSTLMGQT